MLRRAAAATAVILLASPGAALARGGGDDGGGGHGRGREVRQSGSCGSGASAALTLKQEDGAIAVEWEVERHRGGERWRVSFARNGWVLARGTARTRGRSGSFSYERRISDLPGADRVSARAVGPGGRSCTATATLPSR